jgi:hypothetical protein
LNHCYLAILLAGPAHISSSAELRADHSRTVFRVLQAT